MSQSTWKQSAIGNPLTINLTWEIRGVIIKERLNNQLVAIASFH
ncbi:MAG: hypothetical protein AB4063_16705 [Crocosphaera sp.]